MEITNVSSLTQDSLNNCYTMKENSQNYQKNYLEENCLDSVELSQKQGVLKSFGKGILFSIGQLVPFLGSHIFGNMAYNQQEAAEIVEDLKDGDVDNKITKKGAGSKIFKGICDITLYSIPFIGTYLSGKHKYERENLAQDIIDVKDGKQIENHSKKGVIKTYFKGVLERIKVAIPFYGTYYLGKEAAKMENLNTDAKNIAKTLSPDSVEEKK